MTVRKVVGSDRAKIYNLIQEFLIDFNRRELLTGFLLKYNEFKDINSRIDMLSKKFTVESNEDVVVFVDEDDGVLRGYISGNILNHSDQVLSMVGEIDHWFVSKDFRAKGIGKNLWDALMKDFESRGVRAYKVSAFAANSKAIDIYKRYGFEVMSYSFIKSFEPS